MAGSCTLYVLVQYRAKTGSDPSSDPSRGTGLIQFSILSGEAASLESQLEALLHETADASSLKVLGFTCCCELDIQ